MQNNNSSEQIDPGAALPGEVKRTSAQSTAPRPLPEGARAGAAAPVPESESFPGIGESIARWLGEGFFSGSARGAVSALTDVLFFLSFIVCYSWGFINTTMFKNDFSDAFKLRMDGLLHFAVINALLCGVIALLLQDSLQQAVFEVILLAAGFCHWKFGAGKYEYFVLCVLIVGMTGRSFKMLLAIAFSIGTAMMAVTFAASQLGIITDLVYEGGRHSFGIIYCTDCAAHILFLMIIYLFLRLDSLKLVEYVALLLVCAIMMLTKAQSDIMCGFLLMAGILVYRLTRKWHRKKVFRVLGSVMSFSYIICVAAIFIITLGFDRNNKELRKKLQYSLIRRLEMNQEALREHPFSLFGSTIEEHGFGGRTENLPGWDKYFFIDCSYIRLFVIGGVLLFIMILMVMTYAQLRCFAFKRYGFLFLLTVVAVACFLEHHLMEYYYNVFPLLAFSGRRFFKDDPIPETG